MCPCVAFWFRSKNEKALSLKAELLSLDLVLQTEFVKPELLNVLQTEFVKPYKLRLFGPLVTLELRSSFLCWGIVSLGKA